MIIPINLGENSYDIVVEKNILSKVGEILNLNRKTLVITDDGVPQKYAKAVVSQCKKGYLETIPSGEESKSLEVYSHLLKRLLDYGFNRGDCIVAVGGGVVGDLSGFVASTYMRGIDFYNIPTTALSQIDSSIGGKTEINFSGIKNIVGAFYQPKKVIIDTALLSTLPQRQIANGLSEAVKMSLTNNKELFELFEEKEPMDFLEEIITSSLMIKKSVVEKDEKEAGLRKILNFGHTIGHGIEATQKDGKLYHGECVALGMLSMTSDTVKERLIKVLKKLNLPTDCNIDKKLVFDAICHDKKFKDDKITVIYVEQIGKHSMRELAVDELNNIVENM